jgi:hypothetical protein
MSSGLKAVLGLAVLGLAALLTAGVRPALANQVTLDFEDLPGMTYWQGNIVPLESRVQEQFLSYGVRFDSPAGYAAVMRLGEGHATSGVNGIGSVTNKALLTYNDAYPMVLTFWDLNDSTRRATTGFVSARGDLAGGSAPVSMRGYDLDGHLIASVIVADTGGETVAISVPGIHRVELRGGRDTGFDDLTFDPPVPEASEVRVFRIGFEEIAGLPSGESGQIIPLESAVTDQYRATHGVRFSSVPGYVGVARQGLFATSGMNAIGGATDDQRLTYDPAFPIDISFWDPSAPEQPATADYVSIRGDTDPKAGAGVLTLEAFGTDDALLATDTQPDNGGTLLEVFAPGIRRVRLTGNSSNAFDDLVFHHLGLLPLAGPTGLKITVPAPPNGQTTLLLEWTDNSSDESGFKIERKTGTNAFAEIGQTGADVVAFTDTNLAPGTSYTYRVHAFNAEGNSAYSNTVSGATLPLPPAAPSNLAVNVPGAPDGATKLQLGWADNATNESGFKIERKTGSDAFAEIAKTSANAVVFNDTNLAPSTSYSYRVRAFNAGGNSLYSKIASASTLPPPLAAPSNLAVIVPEAPDGATKLQLGWTDNATNESGFKVERKTRIGAFAEITQVGADVVAFNDSNLAPNTSYSYRVRAFNADGASAYSNTAGATTLRPTASAPSNLSLLAASSTLIKVSWTDNADNEKGFWLERSENGGASWPVTRTVRAGTGVGSTISFWDHPLVPGTTYTYRVRAFSTTVDPSAYAGPVSATTEDAPPAPSALSVVVTSTTMVKLTWRDNAANEWGFKLERSQDGGATWPVTRTVRPAAGAGSTVYFADKPLNPGTSYTYRVRAYNGEAFSAYAGPVTAQTDAIPVAPSALTATALSTTDIRLTWTDNADNEWNFKLERSDDGGATWAEVRTIRAGAGVGSTMIYRDRGLSPGTTYSYRVRAFNGGSYSGYAGPVSEATL